MVQRAATPACAAHPRLQLPADGWVAVCWCLHGALPLRHAEVVMCHAVAQPAALGTARASRGMFSGFFRTCSPQASCTPQSCSSCQPAAAQERITVGDPSAPTDEPFTLHAESQVPRLPPRGDALGSRARRLAVPAIFTRFQFSVIYTQLGATQGTLMDQQKTMLQAILKHFTKDLTCGVMLTVVDQDGRCSQYFCRLDRGMTQITMQSDDSTPAKALVLRDVERICSPEEVRNLRSSSPFFIDECCTTVVLVGQRFVTFRLESVAAREYLMLGLQVLRMSQDRARMWYT